ncbi:hypothetical protein SDC9_90956 [bioreactor metagenome]|uniref:Uncharacterized protein n=1 Tax=bioreactor metagenome TaxID=1076179 RepID=A0A644ZV26_9ZZZZ
MHQPRAPVHDFGREAVPARAHAGVGERCGDLAEALFVVGGFDVVLGDIDVDADKVERAADGAHVFVGEARGVGACGGEVAFVVFAGEHDVEKAVVVDARGAFGGAHVGGGVADGHGREQHVGRADLQAPGTCGAHGLHAQAVGEHGVVGDLVEFARGELEAGGQFDALLFSLHDDGGALVAHVHEVLQFVEGEEVLDAVAQAAGDGGGIVGKGRGRVTRLPAALVLQGLRQVPVVEGDEGLDACLKLGIDEAGVEVHARFVHFAGAVGEDARPRDGKPVGVGTQLADGLHVFAVAVVVVDGDVAGVSVGHLAGGVGVDVPDGLALAVGVGRAFDLIGGGGDTPAEAVGE